MSLTDRTARAKRAKNLRIMAAPLKWPCWPFLPLARHPDGEDEAECGLLYDAFSVGGVTGLGATVFHANLFLLPPTEAEFLALPRSTYDTLEEVLDDGWYVD